MPDRPVYSINGRRNREHHFYKRIIPKAPFYQAFVVTPGKQYPRLLRKLEGKYRVAVAGESSAIFSTVIILDFIVDGS